MRGSRSFLIKILIYSALLSVLAAGISGLAPKASAAAFTYQTKVTYTVASNGNTHVSQLYTITNNTDKTIVQGLQLTTPTDQVDNIKVYYNDGSVIPYTKTIKTTTIDSYSYQYIQIEVKFPRTNAGAGVSWSFGLEYDTSKLVESKGSSHTVFIPAIGESDLTQNYSISLIVPDDFGTAHATTTKPTYGGIQKGQATYLFDKKDLIKQSASLVFGDSTIYNVDFSFPLKNSSSHDQTFTVALPPDTPSQKIFINSISPQPQARRLDEDGNVLADFKVAAGHTTTVHTDIDGVVKYMEYDLNQSGNKSDIPSGLAKKYTAPTHYWQANDPRIVTKASQVAAGAGNNVANIVSQMNKFVIDTLSYNNDKIAYNIRQGALNALDNPSNAVCLEYSDLLIALLRSQGIPARMPVGYAYSGNLKKSTAVSDSLHSWVEVYIPKVGWINVDPTWGEKFNSFGKSDMDHFAFAIWGQQDGTPSAVSSRGNDLNYQYEAATLKYKSSAQTTVAPSYMKITSYVIAPFVSLARVTTVAPGNVSGDNYQIEVTDNKAESFKKMLILGSLAAGQEVSHFVGVVGNSANHPLTARLLQKQEGVPILATADGRVSYWPMIIIIVALAIIFGLILIKSITKRSRSKSAVRKQKEI